jgi:hypothetical protein
MKTLFLNAVLFTLADREVAKNKYLPIFYTWVSKLIQNGKLGRDDFLLISIDERTIEYLKTNSGILGTLMSYLPCPYAFKIFPAPATLLEGMKMRYKTHDFKQDVFMYMDVDILVMKSLRLIVDQTENAKLYVCTEGTLRDPNYGADMSSTDDPGYTSAIFMTTAPWVQEVLFRRVDELYRDAGYYTIDQPFYNRAVYMMPHNNKLLTSLHSFNGHNYSKEDTVLLNCGGEPGRDDIHYDKIQEVLCLINVGFF